MRVLIAGGGTGGHIYPAISIARAILEKNSKSIVEFVGTPQGLEAKLIPQAGFKIHTVQIGRLNKNVDILERIKTLITLPIAILKSFWIVHKFKPDVVLGVGGYASGPLVFAAALMRVRALIWEPNAYPGLANRLLSYVVNEALVVFAESKKYLTRTKVTQVHMPVRREIEAASAHHSSDKFRILIFGGSQGARKINDVVTSAVIMGGDWLENVEIVHQTGSNDYERIRAVYHNLSNAVGRVSVLEYLHDMPERYAWADLVIARAGTGTISELAACGKAAILIPLPTAADDHQTKNAKALVAVNGAILVPQKDLSPQVLMHLIKKLNHNREEIQKLETNIKKFHQPRADLKLAEIIIGELKT